MTTARELDLAAQAAGSDPETTSRPTSTPPDVHPGPRPEARPEPSGSPDRPRATADPRPALLRVAHAEIVKLLSLRSTVIALAVAALLVVGLGSLMTAGVAFEALQASDDPDTPPVAALDAPMGGVGTALFAIAALGVLAVSAEYSTRTIRSTLAAVPRRSLLVAGKAVAVAAVTFAVALPSTLVAYVGGRLMLAVGGVPAEAATPDAARMVVGAALYLVVVALIGSGFAWLLRSTAGALTALVGLLILAPALATLLPPAIGERVAPFLPSVGAAVFASEPAIHPWAGLLVLATYGVALLVVAAARIQRRDS